MNDPILLIVSAPSGCGKGTILGEVFKNTEVFYSVSCTTRAPRIGEEDGKHYHFLSVEQFDKMVENNEFLEHAGFSDNQYGTPEKPVKEHMALGMDAVLEIETNGAFQVKEKLPEAISVFILPPSIAELRRRLNKRGTETPEKIEKRVAAAAGEIALSPKYDYVIMNDDLEAAVRDFETVYKAARNRDSSADCFKPCNEDVINMINEVLENA